MLVAVVVVVAVMGRPVSASLNPEELVCRSGNFSFEYGHAGGLFNNSTFLHVHFITRPNNYTQLQPGQCGWSTSRAFKPGEPMDLCADVGASEVHVDGRHFYNMNVEHFQTLPDLLTTSGQILYYRVHQDTLDAPHGQCLKVEGDRR